MIKAITGFCFALIAFSGFAQQPQNILAHIHSANPMGEVSLKKVTTGPAGELVILGEYGAGAVVYDGNSASHTAQSHFLMKIDSSGNHAWTQTLGGLSYIFLQDMAVNEYGEIFISGNYEDSISFDSYTEKGSGFQPFMWKIDPNGNFEFAFDFRSNPQNIVRPRFALGEGEVVVLINARDSLLYGNNKMLPNKSTDRIGFLARYDYQGNLISQQRFDSPEYFFLQKPERLGKNEILFSVITDHTDSLFIEGQYITGNSLQGTWILGADTSFTVQQQAFIEYEGFAGFTYRGKDSDSNLLFSGTFSQKITADTLTIENANYPDNEISLEDGFFLVLNPSFVPVMLTSIGVADDNTSLRGAIELGNTYFLAGSAKGDLLFNLDTTLRTTANSQLFLLEITPQGQVKKLLSSEALDSTSGEVTITDITAFGHDSFVISGKASTDFTLANSDTLYTKSRFDAFLWLFTKEDIGIIEFPSAPVSQFFFPNPAQNRVSFQVERSANQTWSLSVFDLQGKPVHKATTTEADFDISALRSGIYIFQLQDENGQTIGLQKMVVK